MQLNVYVPGNRRGVVRLLDAASKQSGRPKNELVLEAIERFLRTAAVTHVAPSLGRHHLGHVRTGRRGDLYGRRLGRA